MKNAVRFTTEKSSSWIITTEALLIGGVVGWILFAKNFHPALAITVAILLATIVRQAIVHVEAIFWIWTFGLGGGSGYLLYVWVAKAYGDKGWAIFWAVAGFLVVVGMHVTSREHSQIEGTPNEVKILRK